MLLFLVQKHIKVSNPTIVKNTDYKTTLQLLCKTRRDSNTLL